MVDRTKLFDGQAYLDSGGMPYSWLAYPTSIADADGLPPDAEALKLIALVQARGVPLGTWDTTRATGSPHTLIVVRREHIDLVWKVLEDLAAEGVIERNFPTRLSERLMGEGPRQLEA